MTDSRSLEMNFEPFSCLALSQLKQAASDGDKRKTWQPTAGSSIWMTSTEASHLAIWPRFHLWIVRSKRRKKMRMHFLLCMSFEWHLPRFVFLAETSCKRPAFKCISKHEVFMALGICTWLVIWLYLIWPLMVLLLQMQWFVLWLMTIWTVLWVGPQNCGRKVAQPGPMALWDVGQTSSWSIWTRTPLRQSFNSDCDVWARWTDRNVHDFMKINEHDGMILAIQLLISMHRACPLSSLVRYFNQDKQALHREVLSQPLRGPKVLTRTLV